MRCNPILPRPLVAAAALLSFGAAPLLAQSRADTREAGRTAPTAPTVPTPPPQVTIAPAPPAPVKSQPGIKVTLSADGQTIYLVGMIMDGSFHRFDEVLRGAPKARTVHLSSAGGYTIEARMIAALVRKRKLDTYVEFYCASACTQIFAAGRQRTIGPSGQLGFHQAVLLNERGGAGKVRLRTDRKLSATTVFGVNGNDTLRLAYELAGIDPAFIDKALAFSHDNMWLPSSAELSAAHVITRQADKPELPPAPGGGGTRDEVRARLLQGGLWRAALASRPGLTEKTIDEVWRTSNSGLTFDDAAAVGRTSLVLAATRTLGRAPDALLARSLAIYTGSAASQRERGYPACTTKIGELAERTSQDLAFEQQEDLLVADFLLTDKLLPPMDGTEATRIFAREVLPKLVGSYRVNLSTGQEGKCKLGFQTFEAIGSLPPKQRLRAYRALLSLPGLADAE